MWLSELLVIQFRVMLEARANPSPILRSITNCINKHSHLWPIPPCCPKKKKHEYHTKRIPVTTACEKSNGWCLCHERQGHLSSQTESRTWWHHCHTDNPQSLAPRNVSAHTCLCDLIHYATWCAFTINVSVTASEGPCACEGVGEKARKKREKDCLPCFIFS